MILEQPKATIIGKEKVPKSGRKSGGKKTYYLLLFDGYPEEDADWISAKRIKCEITLHLPC